MSKPCPHKLLKKQLSGMQVWYVCDGWMSVRVTPEPGIEVLTVDWVSNVYLLASWSDRDRRWYDDDGGECSPTHWRNLPSPPSENAGKCGQKFKAQEWDGRVRVVKRCIGYPDCDADLGVEPHTEKCPLYGTDTDESEEKANEG